MADETTKPDCLDCRWWREQTGSAHVLCPTRPDFAFCWGTTRCDLYAPVLEDEEVARDGVNAFIYWGGGEGGMPTSEQIMAWFDAHPEYKTAAFEEARLRWEDTKDVQEVEQD